MLAIIACVFFAVASAQTERRVVFDIFSFMNKVDSSGFLIFAGIASGIIYTKTSLVFYRNIAFLSGFVYAIAQSAIAAMEVPVEASFYPTIGIVLLLVAVLIFGLAFIIFSLLAMAAYEHELKNGHSNGSDKNGLDACRSANSVNLNLSMKNDSVQPSHDPSGLTLDLRYSQSGAHRSPEQR